MRQLDIPIHFCGTIRVRVPDHLSIADAQLLATKIALTRILATTEKPDAPEDDVFEDYTEECSDPVRTTADQDWDRCEVGGVCGQWSIT